MKASMAILAAGLLLAGHAAASRAQGAGDAAANWDRVVQCARQSGARSRHACLDQLLRDKGLIDTARETAEAREAFGRAPRAEAAPAPPAPKASSPTPSPAAQARPAQSPPLAPAAQAAPAETKLTQLETQVASTRLGADRKLLVTTAEGAIWRQTEAVDLHLQAEKGDAFTIEATALGGHRCKIGKSKIFRCQRTN